MMRYTHSEYRNARVVHVTKKNKETEFYYRGKQITLEEANTLTNSYYQKKQRKIEGNENEGTK